jgi:hypothetical protein
MMAVGSLGMKMEAKYVQRSSKDIINLVFIYRSLKTGEVMEIPLHTLITSVRN